jgi:phage N-6-adenine-methyltransferase
MKISSMMSVHFSSERDDWPTPKWLFDALNREFGFTLDPCSTHENAKCEKHFTVSEDGLREDWSDEVVFMNPPYGRAIGAWMKRRINQQGKARRLCVLFRPERTRLGGINSR